MNIAGFVQAYIKPSRWWRRRKSVEVTIWPQFLAQALCPHVASHPIMWDTERKTITYQCIDCHKHITEANPCAHGGVVPHSTDRFAKETIVRSYLCAQCGLELQPSELPKDAKVVYPPYEKDTK
jgi:DNA-directed RNA polymerase subunit RPC12/RpoP